MKARLIKAQRQEVGREEDEAFIEISVWQVPSPVRGSAHRFKYRLALVVHRVCVMRYDNEAGKGDHKHVDESEFPYEFVNLGKLQRDFGLDARRWLARHARH